MKKIIATVLAMVMALALCTTAFAAETTTTIKKDGYSVATIDNSTITAVAADFTKTTKDNKVVTDSTGTTTTVYPACYTIGTQKYYVVDAGVAEYKLIKDNAVVEYLTTVDLKDGVSDVVSSAVAAKDSADDLVCGDYVTKTAGVETPVAVYVVDGKAYVQATSGKAALLNGKVVFYGAEATAKDHVFTKMNTTTDNKGKIVSITCDSCKKSFTVVESGKVPANYAGKIDALTLANAGRVILLGSTTTLDSGKTNTTTSPKTFDAGIAMYVGMALTSVAGSAVVIGKKKEF